MSKTIATRAVLSADSTTSAREKGLHLQLVRGNKYKSINSDLLVPIIGYKSNAGY